MNQKPAITIKQLFLIIGIGIGILGICAATFFLKQPHKNPSSTSPTPPPIPKPVTNLLKDISGKTSLPPDEVPTVATVTDLTKLDQTFFLKAAKGDKILMFIASKQAYLYRPSTKQIINHGTLEIETGAASESAEQTTGEAGKATNPNVLRVRF